MRLVLRYALIIVLFVCFEPLLTGTIAIPEMEGSRPAIEAGKHSTSKDLSYLDDQIVYCPKSPLSYEKQLGHYAPQTYYVSAAGSDGNSGLSSGTAWKTVAKVNAHSFSPGDVILFRKGDIFRETLVVPSNGSAGNPITISSYGSGEKPVFSIPLITNWTHQGGGVYRAAMRTHEFTGVWEDYIPVQPKASSAALTNGRWYQDGTYLYYRPSSGTPDNHQVSAVKIISSYDSGITVSDRKYITITNLSFYGVPTGVFSIDEADGTESIVVRNCDFQYCQSAILMLPNLSNNRNAIIDGNYFYRNHNAVRMYTASANSPGVLINGQNLNCQIINNEMFENGTIDGMTPWDYGFTDYEAIGLQNFSDGTIADNFIHDGFALGIIMYNLPGMTSDDNKITRNRFFDNDKVPLFLTGKNAGTDADFSYNGNIISHNIFVGNDMGGNPAVWFDQGWSANRTNYFVNNVCVGKEHQIQISRGDIPIYYTIRNNIFYGVDYNLWIYGNHDPSQLVLDHNIYYANPPSWGWAIAGDVWDHSDAINEGYAVHSKIMDPEFVDVANRDFRLKQGSPAIDAGIPTLGVSTDKEGYTMGATPNIGAYEKVAGSATSPPEQPAPDEDKPVDPDPGDDVADKDPPEEKPDPDKLVVTPNPAGNYIELDNVAYGSLYKIYSMNGRPLVYGLYTCKIWIHYLPAGTYVIVVNGQSIKFVKS